MNTIKVVLLVV